MITSLRRLFNYWLPPGVNDTSPVLNPFVDLAVKINASCLAMLSGGKIDWDEVTRQNAEWAKLTARVTRREVLTELTRLSEEMGGYDPSFYTQRTPKSTSCEDRYVSFHAPDETTYSAFNEQLKQCEAVISQVLLAPATEAGLKSASPSADQTQEPSTETKC